MQSFVTSRDAKVFLVNTIVAEAERENVPLSPTERDMLFFSETAWCPLEDYVKTNEDFTRECDAEEYEEKIQKLIRALRTRMRKSDSATLLAWDQAVAAIRDEDHYLLVMISAAHAMPVTPWRPTRRTALIALTLALVMSEIAYLLITR